MNQRGLREAHEASIVAYEEDKGRDLSWLTLNTSLFAVEEIRYVSR